MRTDRDEVDSITEVVPRTEADIFPVEWHGQENNKRRCRASRQNHRDPHKPGESPALHSPEDVELFFDASKVPVAGGEGGFAIGGEGGGETVGIR